MAVYVDRLRDHGDAVRGYARRYGTQWCHMIADSEPELHAFATRIGLQFRWAQYPGTIKSHYDLIPSKRALALRLGALSVDDRTFVDIRKRQRDALSAAGTP
jgi:hypothetical protein